MRPRATSLSALAVVLALPLALAGCEPEEQDRVLHLDKGTYAGKPDTELTPAQIEALRQRARMLAGQ